MTEVNMDSRFSKIEVGPDQEIFHLIQAYNRDHHANKVDLAPGVYRTDKGEPWVLPVVKQTEQAMSQNPQHEYLPVLGLPGFTEAATKFLLGKDSTALQTGRAFGVQALGGTGALRIAAEFLVRQLDYKVVYCSKPTWGNHKMVFSRAGFQDIREYRYWDSLRKELNFPGLLEDLNLAPENSVIILHACAHNPTGCDPTKEQWMEIAQVMKSRKLFPMFDAAYQGFATGDPEADAWAVRHFIDQGFELICAQSFSKNFGLYGERVGNATFVTNNPSTIAGIKSQVQWNIRSLYSNPPTHGPKIVSTILNDPELYSQWKKSVILMSDRVKEMRYSLRSRLEEKMKMSWEHITRHNGLFSYTGLTPEQCKFLIQHYHIYLLDSGRINMCGLNLDNINYVVDAFVDAIKRYPS